MIPWTTLAEAQVTQRDAMPTSSTDLKAISGKTEEHEGIETVKIPSVVTDGDLEQDFIMLLQKTGLYDRAKRTDSFARWKGLAKTEKELVRPQQENKEAGFTFANASKGFKEADMETKFGADIDCQPACKPEQDGRGSRHGASPYKIKQSTGVHGGTLAENKRGSLRDRVQDGQPSNKKDRGRDTQRHRSSSPRGRSMGQISR
ncbi:hypothetical protein PspLS_03668 [Pyricularia sp. CBS 133598]|nr:hypothetical protein PspLS_03668 [Pyricularia sp. CBS 133598]